MMSYRFAIISYVCFCKKNSTLINDDNKFGGMNFSNKKFRLYYQKSLHIINTSNDKQSRCTSYRNIFRIQLSHVG